MFHSDYKHIIDRLPEGLVKRACERLLHHSKDPVPLEAISEKSEQIESYLRHTLEVYENSLNRKHRNMAQEKTNFFGKFMQDIEKEYRKRINANKKLRCEINDLKTQLQETEKELASMKVRFYSLVKGYFFSLYFCKVRFWPRSCTFEELYKSKGSPILFYNHEKRMAFQRPHPRQRRICEEYKAELEEENYHLRSELQTEVDTNHQNERRINQLEQDYSQCEQEIQVLNREIEHLENASEEEITELKSEISSLKNKLCQAKKNVRDKEKNISALENQLVEFEEQVEKLRCQIKIISSQKN
ncbi:hypothetical protein RclHR1_11960007 [Rhizophagus clarus]|uniref:Uncharacterized protein n=2 Tax=Rhizophagus clarus TaxID=94130 RepID=A0A2Z6QI13_9GLOM|nr:hypothetical protein RclHR1_11960007 [Rhizophagus clarus]